MKRMTKLVMAAPENNNVSGFSDEMGITPLSIQASDMQNPSHPAEEKLWLQSFYGVGPGAKGEGLPYAPQGWPDPEDKWGWKVGKRTTPYGCWRDRYLLLPKSLQQGRKTMRFQSKLEVEKYLTKLFPGIDMEKFFASFQWQVPACIPLQMTTKNISEEDEVFGEIPNFPNAIAMDREQSEVIPDLRNLPADIRALTVEKEVYRALHMLRQSQEREYRTAQQKLFAQKDLLATLFQPTNGTVSSSTLEKSAEKEFEKFLHMLGNANALGSTSREFLQHQCSKGSGCCHFLGVMKVLAKDIGQPSLRTLMCSFANAY